MAYIALQIGDMIIGGDDAPDSDIKQLTSGNMLSIGLVPDSKKGADTIFKKLSAAGKVTMKMTDYPWGYIGGILDNYGVNWTVWYKPQPPEKQVISA